MNTANRTRHCPAPVTGDGFAARRAISLAFAFQLGLNVSHMSITLVLLQP